MNFDIILENGTKISEYYKDQKTYIEGRKGSNFIIRLKNTSGKKKAVVVSVDGLDVISGKPANKDSQGYLINPYETLDIEGWRISNSEIKKFFFGHRDSSYTEKAGQGKVNTGVIGIMTFNEECVPRSDWQNGIVIGGLAGLPQWTNDSYPVAGGSANVRYLNNMIVNTVTSPMLKSRGVATSSAAAPLRSSLGTGMGESKISHSKQVEFKRDYLTMCITEKYYFTRKELEKMGIIKREKKVDDLPRAFGGFCKVV